MLICTWNWQSNRTRAPHLLPGPTISLTSFRLKLSMPPLNLPTAGAPTPLSRLLASPTFRLTLSSTMPFSLASLLRVSSVSDFFFTIPFRWLMGMRSCARRLFFEPRDWRRRSIALRLCLAVLYEREESRRWDSWRSRWSATSFLRLVASVWASSEEDGSLARALDVGPFFFGIEGGLDVYRPD
jgi:hypothetical protein